MAEPVVVTSGDVQGNITSCKIENQTKAVRVDSPFALQQNVEYITYDVCNKQVIAEYNVPQITGFGFFLGFIIAVVIIGVIFAFISRDDFGYIY